MEIKKPQLLIIDDEQDILSSLKRLFFKEPVNVFLTNNYAEAMSILAKESIQVVMSDQRMPEISGVAFLSTVKVKYPKVIRILFTGYGDVQVASDAKKKAGVYVIVAKPWDGKELKALIRRAIDDYGVVK